LQEEEEEKEKEEEEEKEEGKEEEGGAPGVEAVLHHDLPQQRDATHTHAGLGMADALHALLDAQPC
jgi:hypothetical protein